MKSNVALLQIGDVAERVGLSIRTLRHWEDVGLVQPAERSKGGFRLYSDADVEHLLVAKSMKPLGLALEEMAELLRLLELSSLPPDDRDVRHDELIARLEAFARRAEERIRRIVRDLGDATTLLENINAGIRSCRMPAENVGVSARESDSDD